ncbi:MAG: NAD(P)H-dependent oxidoreductase [Rhodomicrobium sp.]|nr:NAD(P)H-dependent oxidoreductase [Rhodomicrobium sp.]
MKVVGLAGSPSIPSRTRLIVEAAIERIGAQTGAQTRLVDLAQLVPDLGIRCRADASPRVEEALRLIETASLLVVASPVYKGSYTGLFKHLIDLINYPSLLGTPVALLAMGGSERSALVVEYQLRPLFSFFGAKTLPTAVFIPDKAIVNGWVEDAACSARLDQMIAEAVHELKSLREMRASA